jgi:hypothetical protein
MLVVSRVLFNVQARIINAWLIEHDQGLRRQKHDQLITTYETVLTRAPISVEISGRGRHRQAFKTCTMMNFSRCQNHVRNFYSSDRRRPAVSSLVIMSGKRPSLLLLHCKFVVLLLANVHLCSPDKQITSLVLLP